MPPPHELLHAGPHADPEQSGTREHQEEAEDVQAEVSKGGEDPSKWGRHGSREGRPALGPRDGRAGERRKTGPAHPGNGVTNGISAILSLTF